MEAEVEEIEEAKEVEEQGSRSSKPAILTGSRRTASGLALTRRSAFVGAKARDLQTTSVVDAGNRIQRRHTGASGHRFIEEGFFAALRMTAQTSTRDTKRRLAATRQHDDPVL